MAASEKPEASAPPPDATGADPSDPSANGDAAANGNADDAPKDPLAQLAEERAATQRMREQWMRTAADFDNFRKRARRELEDARKSGREDLLKELLPVFDNLERGLQSAQQATDVKGVVDGLQMIVKHFESTLARTGITRVATVGNAFDPAMHEAIQQVETNEHPAGTIVAEVQPGYSTGDRLIRAAMVVVAKPKSQDGDAGAASQKH